MQSVSIYFFLFFIVLSGFERALASNNTEKYRAWLNRFERAVAGNNPGELQEFFVNETEALYIANSYRHLIPEIAVQEYIPLMASQIQQRSDSSFQVIRVQYLSKARGVVWIGAEEKIENQQTFVLLTVAFEVGGKRQNHRLAGILINDELNILEIQ